MYRGLQIINDNGDLLVLVPMPGGDKVSSPYKTFIYSNGKYKVILPPGFKDFQGWAMNNNREVIRNYLSWRDFYLLWW